MCLCKEANIGQEKLQLRNRVVCQARLFGYFVCTSTAEEMLVVVVFFVLECLYVCEKASFCCEQKACLVSESVPEQDGLHNILMISSAERTSLVSGM